MDRKLILPAMAMSLVLVFTACSKAVVPDETIAATTSEIATQTATEDTATETTEKAKTRRVPLDHTFNPHCLSGIYIDKYGEEFEEKGRDVEEGTEAAKLLAAAGVDCFDTDQS